MTSVSFAFYDLYTRKVVERDKKEKKEKLVVKTIIARNNADKIHKLEKIKLEKRIANLENEVSFVKEQLMDLKVGILDVIRKLDVDNSKDKKSSKRKHTKKEYREALIKGLKHWEGFKPRIYTCSGGVKTIGYGFTGSEIKGRTYISKEEAERQLVHEILPKYEKMVDRVVKVKLTHNQRMALVDFAFNFGEKPLRTLVNGKGRLNSGNYKSIEKIMPMYRKSGGQVRRGLVLRRQWALKLWKGEICNNYGN